MSTAAPAAGAHKPSLRHLLVGTGWSASTTIATRVCAVVSVPLVLHRLGSPLYAVWVVTGALFLAQGLVDLGISAALVRFVAAASAAEAGEVVRAVIRRALVFYLGLSVVLGVPAAVWAGSLASAFPHLPGAEHAAAAALIRYAAAAFALTNVALVFTSALQGMDRVASAFRAQTIGWIVYLPVIVLGFRAGLGVDAIGLAWIACFTVQLALQAPLALSAARHAGDVSGVVPRWREMLSLGGRWQISTWADFATFQLPRLVGAGLLSSSELVSLDVAMRAGQIVVSPLFAFFPMVLPTVAGVSARGGREAVRRWLDPLYAKGTVAVTLAAAAAIPLIVPLLALWTGRPARDFSFVVTTAIVLGVVAHASTGLLTSALLALGEITPVLWLKWPQFLVAAVLLAPAALVGAPAVAIVLAVALAVPALVFNHRIAGAFGLGHPVARTGGPVRLLALVALVTLPTAPIALLTHAGTLAPWVAALAAIPLAAACLAAAWLVLDRGT